MTEKKTEVTSKSQNESFGIWISTRDGTLSEAELIESVHQRKESRKATHVDVGVGGCVRVVLAEIE